MAMFRRQCSHASNMVLLLSVGVLLRLAVAKKSKKAAAREAEKLKNSQEWMEENANREGVVTFEYGLQYKVIKNGTGVYLPKNTTKIAFLGTVTTREMTPDFANKTPEEWNPYILDDSRERNMPPDFMEKEPKCKERGPAVSKIMMLMVEGDEYEMYISPDHDSRKYLGDDYYPGEVIVYRMVFFYFDEKSYVGKRKYRCQVLTRTYCLPGELEVLKELGEVTLENVENLIEKVKKRKKKTLSEGEKKKHGQAWRFLLDIQKALKRKQLDEL
mmetsp:Transcript_72971/g.133413  ORF Transcript_72971/g.133413 Transcript_72971/m.133413 type:complete len:272 (+) Transcript_72971:42-857(+)